MFVSRRAFTLVETLVVMALLLLLAALVVPALQQARATALAAQSLSRLHALGQATSLFVLDNQGHFPQSSHQRKSWVKTLRPYYEAPGPTPFRSPGDPVPDRTLSYAINDFLTPKPYGAKTLDFSNALELPAAVQTLLFAETADTYSGGDHFHFADSADGGYSPPAFRSEVAVARYNGAGLYLFADGHAEMRPWADVEPRLARVGSRFIRPDGNRQTFNSTKK